MPDGITLAEVLHGECSAPDCPAESLEDVPFPICAAHFIAIIRNYQQQISGSGFTDNQYLVQLGMGTFAPEPCDRRPVKIIREYVYFIRFRDRIKIGFTTNLPARLVGLPFDEILAVIPGGPQTEHGWHQRYQAARDKGEWFRYTDRMMTEIRALGICA